MVVYRELLPELDAAVRALLPQQVTDPGRPDAGGFVSADGLANPCGVSGLSTLAYGYLLPESAHYRSAQLIERIELGAAFGRRARRPSGCFDLNTTNFDSAPDTAFTVQALAPAVTAARQAQDPGARRIADALGELIRAAVPGMIAGGFHTPNHRWVLVSALARAGRLFPDLEVLPTIEAYLAEGIDINADGEYAERSTGVYNAVVNRALRLSAEALDRPELLEPVRRNLELSYRLMHADATVVTSISQRQDRGARVVPVGLADSYYALGRMDGNGFLLAVADWLCAAAGSGMVCLPLFVDHQEWRTDGLSRASLPVSYELACPTSGLWRVRRRQLSATAAAGLTTPFAVVYGAVELTAVRISSTYFATGQFVGEQFDAGPGRARLRHLGRNRLYPERPYRGGVYWLPATGPVTADNWVEVRRTRPTYQLPALEVDLDIVEVAGGFDLRVRSAGGLDAVPFQIECAFAPGGELELEGAVVRTGAGATVILGRGRAVYRVGTDAISIGPGALRHRMWEMRNSETSPDSLRVLITLLTPVEHVLELRCGSWSWAAGGLLPAGLDTER